MRKNKDDEFEKDYYEIEDKLKRYVVPIPTEEEIDFTIDNLRQYVPKKKKALTTLISKMQYILRVSFIDIDYMSKSYWIISVLIFILGYIRILEGMSNAYLSVIALSPIPFVLSMIDVYKGREEGVIEIELTCVIKPQQLILSKLIIIEFYNIILNTIFTVLLGTIYPNVVLWKLSLMWLTPLIIVSGFTLFLANRIRGGYAVTVVLGIWLSVMVYIFTIPEITRKLLSVNITVYLLIIFVGIVIIAVEVKKITNKYYYERSKLNGISY